ncbi:hypothetical protein [uncultured Paraglaciecola sp.]|uniref:DUF7832 domain-containing protein n=1 Tax=uncultured Paraglaciecola sp. TaxID=1765024 RepID=UPI0026078729|nr:hypothetical protein [uncultured Paraglaciecola sp.]
MKCAIEFQYCYRAGVSALTLVYWLLLTNSPAFSADSIKVSSMKYDDASWHPEGTDGEYTLPEGSSRTHIGLFLAWAITRDLVSDYHTKEHADALAEVKARTMTGSEYLHRYCGDKLLADDLNEAGNAFAEMFYEQSYLGGEYLFAADPGMDADSLYQIPDTWATFDVVAAMLDSYFASRM